MSCHPFTQIPSPPTTLPSCAVPIGGSNSSILDACCNGHINAIATYSDPNSDSNAEDDDGCFQFCITDSPVIVRTCLAQKLSEYEKGLSMFECFNVGSGDAEMGYSNAGGRLSAKDGIGWGMGLMLGLWVVGAVAGVV